mmetsp:Transcript_10475/g.15233  ORF Transcript_10475/g.15233 Transcript_10475/m.15233 type:complete len:81 (+) Transcript_10475:172-414(+)
MKRTVNPKNVLHCSHFEISRMFEPKKKKKETVFERKTKTQKIVDLNFKTYNVDMFTPTYSKKTEMCLSEKQTISFHGTYV